MAEGLAVGRERQVGADRVGDVHVKAELRRDQAAVGVERA